METVDELTKLTSDLLARIYRGLHELKDQPLLRVAIMDVLWNRHAITGEQLSWPRKLVQYGTAGDPDAPLRGAHEIVGFCGFGFGAGDLTHGLAGLLDWQPSGGEPPVYGLLCSCGRRSDRVPKLYLRWQQVTPDWRVWPTIMQVVGGRPVPHLRVCPSAQHACDPMHAPNDTGLQCLCGRTLWKDDRLLPAQ